jgi:parallel beta-helix repeat protein
VGRAISVFLTLLALTATASARVLYVEGSLLGNVGTGSSFDPYGELQYAIDQAADGDTLFLRPGIYSARPQAFDEELCGNCQQHRTKVSASRGFLIKDKALHLTAEDAEKTTLITSAGYGVLFLSSRGSGLEKVTITRGKRDFDGNATDAGIVVKNSSVTIQGVIIRDNTDRPDSLVVGIGGIVGREDSELRLIGNEIANNGWDGIALYRGATATIEDNVIRDGRGAGIGLTWDATAIILRNTVTGYWKGIGAFGAARAIVCNNLVQNCLGWGIIATGDAFLDATNNNVIYNGNCGLAIWSETCRGRFLNNIVIQNGWRDEWVAPQVGIMNYGKAENFLIAHNNVWDNVKGNYRDLPDLTGIDGNISANPLFVSDKDHHLTESSPCRNAGSPLISEGDGSISDIGMYGGPDAR